MAIEYLNNKIFEELIANYKKYKPIKHKKPDEFRKAENELTEAFYILADNIIRAFKFQLIEEEDMLQEGAIICFEKLYCFDPNFVTESGIKSKAFNYFTTCTLNHFRQLYRTAKGYKQLKERLYEFLVKKNQDKICKLIVRAINRDYKED